MAAPGVAYDYRDLIVNIHDPISEVIDKLQELGNQGWMVTASYVDDGSRMSRRVFVLVKPRASMKVPQIL